MSYIEDEINLIKSGNRGESEFNQAVHEVLTSINPLIESNDIYKNHSIIKRITEPDRQIKFRVSWIDDNGNVRVNRGYRVQFNNALGPYKGGLRFHPSVNMSVIKFLGFEQIFKNALTGLPIGGAKGGSDFDPKGKSDTEIMRFCQSFMNELFRYIGADRDVPAGDIGVGEREIGYLFGHYKRLKNIYEGALTGKGLSFGGSLVRKQATGYGLIYLTEQMMNKHGYDIYGKTVAISGSGNVAIHAGEKAVQVGCKVLTMSDSTGWIYDPDGIDISVVKNIKEISRGRLSEYKKFRPYSEYHSGKFMWQIPCEIALPCATQNEVDEKCVKNLIQNDVIAVAEGANMPVTLDGINLIYESKTLYAPGKAANAGGVAVSALEMSQNSIRLKWGFEEVDDKLKIIMTDIFRNISDTAETYGFAGNYLIGANVSGFKTVADSMIAQGVV